MAGKEALLKKFEVSFNEKNGFLLVEGGDCIGV